MESFDTKLVCTQGSQEEVMEVQSAENLEEPAKEAEDELESWFLWSGGLWALWEEHGTYWGKNLVKHVLKVPSKNLTHEMLKNLVRKTLGLSMEERFRLTYESPYLEKPCGVEIRSDNCFKIFMETVDSLLKPTTLFHVNLNRVELPFTEGSEEEEADAGGYPLSIARVSTVYSAQMREEIYIQVPKEKVGVLFGKDGKTMKKLLTRSGAHIELLSKAFRPKGITLRVAGERIQIELAEEQIKEVIEQEEDYELELLVYSGGSWEDKVMARSNEAKDYKGNCIVTHTLKLSSKNLTFEGLREHVRAKLGLSSFKLTYAWTMWPVDIDGDLGFVDLLLAVAENRVSLPLTLHVVS